MATSAGSIIAQVRVLGTALGVAVLLCACSEPVERAAGALTASRSPSPSATGASPAPNGEGSIVIASSAPGDEVASPVVVSGRAEAGAATVAVRVLDAQGNELAATAAEAGSRGRFRVELFFLVEERQDGTIEVFQPGAELEPATVPVALVPGA